jgi:Uncharacterized protein conserved in bacteria (DUF2314)
MAEKEIFFANGDTPKMIAAFKSAQDTFKYFWRELSWVSKVGVLLNDNISNKNGKVL